MNFFNLDDKFDEMVSKVIKIKDSRIFNVLWKEYGESLKDEVVTMEIIWCQMWSRICEELRSICKQFYNGEMKLRKVDEYLDIFKNDNDAIINEFIQLSEFFNPNMGQLDQIRKQLEDIIEKMKSYKKLFNTQQAADAVLRLQKVMGLEGDFSQVRSIEKVWPTFFTFHSVTRAETRTLIWGGGCIFIYSCSIRRVSFQIRLKLINLKRNPSAEHEYMNIPPPPINVLVSAMSVTYSIYSRVAIPGRDYITLG